MPEATINEHRNPCLAAGDVWDTEDPPVVNPVAPTPRPQEPPDSQLGKGIFPLDAGHDLAPDALGEVIQCPLEFKSRQIRSNLVVKRASAGRSPGPRPDRFDLLSPGETA